MKKFLTATALTFLALISLSAPVRAFEIYVVNGSSYSFPDVDDVSWGQNVTDWAKAISNNVLYPVGGNFFLNNEVVLGSTYGIRVSYISSTGTLPNATTGFLRMTSGSSITWRNEENTANLYLVLGASNTLLFNGVPLSTTSVNTISSINALLTALSNSTNTLLTMVSTTGVQVINLSNSTSTLMQMISTTGVQVANLSVATTTLQSLIPSSFQRAYTLLIATWAAPGSDMIVTTLQQWNLALASVNACGLVWSTTATATIGSLGGNVLMSGATVPAGITLIGISSPTWIASTSNQNMVKIFGKVTGFNFDLNALSFTSRMVWVSSAGNFVGNAVYNAMNQTGGSSKFASAFFMDGANVNVQGNRISDLKATDGLTYYGDVAPIIIQSTGSNFSDNVITYYGTSNSQNSTCFSLWGTTSTMITRNRFLNMTQNGIPFNVGVKDTMIIGNYLEVYHYGGAPDNGTFFANSTGNRGLAISSGVVIMNNMIVYAAGFSATIFNINPTFATAQTAGLVISGNIVDDVSANSFTFATVGTGAQNTVFTNNHTMSHGASTTFISDSGAGTKYQTLGNFKDGVQQ